MYQKTEKEKFGKCQKFRNISHKTNSWQFYLAFHIYGLSNRVPVCKPMSIVESEAFCGFYCKIFITKHFQLYFNRTEQTIQIAIASSIVIYLWRN